MNSSKMKFNFVEMVKKYFSVQSAYNQVLKNFDTSKIETIIHKYPEEVNNIAKKAEIMCDNFDSWPSLLFTISLIKVNSSKAYNILKKLILFNNNPVLAREKPVCWERLDLNQTKHIIDYLSTNDRNLGFQFYRQLIKRLPEEKLIQFIPEMSSNEFISFSKAYIENNKSLRWLRNSIVNYLEKSALWDINFSTISRAVIMNCREVATMMWNCEKLDEAIEILRIISLIDSSYINKNILACIANSLDCCEGLSLMRAAQLLKDFASKEWLPFLKSTWIRIIKALKGKKFDIIKSGIEEEILEPDVVSVANSIAIALGICAAYDENYTHLELESPKSTKLQHLIDARIKMIEERDTLIRDFQSRTIAPQYSSDTDIVDRINNLNDSIENLNTQINNLEEELMLQCSAGYLLMLVLKNEQEYEANIRQSVAWGLYKLQDLGHLDKKSRKYILESIREAICGSGEAELRARLEHEIIQNEETTQAIYDASLDYFYDRNSQHFIDRLKSFALPDDLAVKIKNIVNSMLFHKFSYNFSERRIQLLPGQTLLEFERLLIEGINWMEDLVEAPDSDLEVDDDILDYSKIRFIVKLMYELMPQTLKFFTLYPLRLMTLNQHKHVLGQYFQNKCDITYWTRYIPPIWKPGMTSEEAGLVKERFLTLDDRSIPNAMGIFYRLFSHPVLCLPVLYHEYLHFGGIAGDPEKGIENETEVLIREIIFAQDLISRLAPENDENIPDYEKQIINAITATGLLGLLIQISYDLMDNQLLTSICEQIVNVYGKPLGEQEAEHEINNRIDFQNRSIELVNLTDNMKRNWYPGIGWPKLSTYETKQITQKFKKILYKSYTCDHRINLSQRDQILSDPGCQSSLTNWKKYMQRTNALQEFKQRWIDINLQQELNYVIYRIKSISEELEIHKIL